MGCTQNERVSLIYLARHGETPNNIARKFADPMKEHLTERGQEQAKCLGIALADIKFTRVYTSNYPRAIETANIALAQSKTSSDLKITIDERIKEREDSKFEGLSYDVGNALIGVGIDEGHPLFEYREFHVEGTEPIPDLLTRQESFFDDLFEDLDKSPIPETVLIVTHGYFIQLLMKHLSLTDKYQVKNWVSDLTEKCMTNSGYHVLSLSMNQQHSEVAKPAGKCWEFLKIHQDDHVRDVGAFQDKSAFELVLNK